MCVEFKQLIADVLQRGALVGGGVVVEVLGGGGRAQTPPHQGVVGCEGFGEGRVAGANVPEGKLKKKSLANFF